LRSSGVEEGGEPAHIVHELRIGAHRGGQLVVVVEVHVVHHRTPAIPAAAAAAAAARGLRLGLGLRLVARRRPLATRRRRSLRSGIRCGGARDAVAAGWRRWARDARLAVLRHAATTGSRPRWLLSRLPADPSPPKSWAGPFLGPTAPQLGPRCRRPGTECACIAPERLVCAGQCTLISWI
jgi:hypothetical protein